MTEIDVSDIVRSLRGRDRGLLFFVVGMEGVYAFLCDGKSRRLEKPKKKKLMHMRFESKSDGRTAEKIRAGGKVTNSEIRRALAEYTDGRGEEGGTLIG